MLRRLGLLHEYLGALCCDVLLARIQRPRRVVSARGGELGEWAVVYPIACAVVALIRVFCSLLYVTPRLHLDRKIKQQAAEMLAERGKSAVRSWRKLSVVN